MSLQEIISRRREELKRKLSGAEDGPADGGDGAGAAGAPGGSEQPAEQPAEAAPADRGAGRPPDGGGRGRPAGTRAAAVDPALVAAASQRRPGWMSAVIVMNTFLLAIVGGVLIYVLSGRSGQPSAADAALTAMAMLEKARQGGLDGVVTGANELPGPIATATQPTTAVTGPLEWLEAESAFAAKKWRASLDRYALLLAAARQTPSEGRWADFLSFRSAQCMWRMGRTKEVRPILVKLTESDSPIVAATACANLGWADEAGGHHMQGRMLAYRAIGALGSTLTASPLAADCDYLIARCLTRKVGGLHTVEQVVPWSRLAMTDPFLGATEASVRRLLDEGAAPLATGKAGPRVTVTRSGDFWSVESWHASLEDLLNQFGTDSGKDIEWQDVAPMVRRRMVNLRLRAATAQRVCEVACGMVGLIARFQWDRIVVHDPQSATVLSRQKELLGLEAVSAWRRFCLRQAGDRRAAQAGFALAALYEWSGDTLGALRQYQLVSRRHQDDQQVAPRALMRCAEIRTALRDYTGAQADLLELRDMFPNYPRSEEVDLRLGRVYMAGGQLDKALRVFLRVQSINASGESVSRAQLEAGDCYYRKGQFEEASRWLARYIRDVKSPGPGRLARAYLLLGRSESAQGKHAGAAEALRRALAAKPDPDTHVQVMLATGEVKLQLKDYFGVLGVLRGTEGEPFSDQRRYEYLMLVSAAYRSMELPDRARALLRQGGLKLKDRELRALVAVEQARCLRESGDLVGARRGMLEALDRIRGGSEAWRAKLDLGEICMETEQFDQAAVIAREVLRANSPPRVRKRALAMLGRSLLHRKQYAEAAAALAELGDEAAGEGAKKGAGK